MMNVSMEMAKGLFFDPKAFEGPVDRAKMKILRQFGAYCRIAAKNSIKTGGKDQHARAGAIPIGHDGKTRYKDFIFFFHDKDKDEVVIGAILLPRKDRTLVPGVLEHGGEVEYKEFFTGADGKRLHRYATRTQEARPHMQVAFDKTVDKNLDKLIENSIVA